MGLSAVQLGTIIDEIKAELTGGVIRRVDQPQPKMILFEITQGRKRYHLLFSAHPRYARCHLTHQSYSNPKKPPSFCQLLRAHLRHKRISIIKQLDGDRIIQFEAVWKKDEPPENTINTVTFVAELIGPASNFFLIDAEGHILGTLSRPQPSRILCNGAHYLPPQIKRGIPFKETLIPPFSGPYFFQLNQSVDLYYSALEKQDDATRLKKDALARFNQNIRRLNKRLNRFSVRLTEAEKSEAYRIYGEILKCHLHEIKPGAEAFSYFEPDSMSSTQKERTVPLNPALSSSENMAWFFKQYKKKTTERVKLAELIQKTEDEIMQLERGLESLSQDENIEMSDYPLVPVQSTQEKTKTKRGPPIYLSSDNIHLIVGRNDRENEEITFRIAHGNDLWVHAQGVPGSHLIVQMPKKKEIPYQTLLEAATLALHFSRYKKAGKGEVMYTFKKYIQRPKHAKPGSVICSQEKTLYLEIIPSRLSQILKNRINPA